METHLKIIFATAKTKCAEHRATTSPIGWERKKN